MFFFFFQAEDGIRARDVTGVQTCALPIYQSTADQFFDPAQFEAYRELGNAIGEDMIKGARLRSLLGRAWGAADGGD